jgi:hypothetical protein
MSKERVASTGIASFIFLLCACPVASAQLFSPEQTLSRVHAYEGGARPPTQIATVFGAPPSSGLITVICDVDGKNYYKSKLISIVGCGQLVYLLPGAHQLTIHHREGSNWASPTIPIRVEAGKTYMVGGAVSRENKELRARVTTSINTMPEGFVVTYKDLYPGYYARFNRQNSRINPDDAK